VRDLERELKRKEKALAEAAALLVLIFAGQCRARAEVIWLIGSPSPSSKIANVPQAPRWTSVQGTSRIAERRHRRRTRHRGTAT
jgi:hypothetical protein